MNKLSFLFKTGAAAGAAIRTGKVATSNLAETFAGKCVEMTTQISNYLSPSLSKAVVSSALHISELHTRSTFKITLYIPRYIAEKSFALPLLLPAVCTVVKSMTRGYNARSYQAENNAVKTRLILASNKKCADVASKRQKYLEGEADSYKKLAERKVSITWNITKCVVTTASMIFVPHITLATVAAVTAGTLVIGVASHYWEKSGNRNMAQTLQQEADSFGAIAEKAIENSKRDKQLKKLTEENAALEERTHELGVSYGKMAEQKLLEEDKNKKLKNEKTELEALVQQKQEANKELSQQREELQKQHDELYTQVQQLQTDKENLSNECRETHQELEQKAHQFAESENLNHKLDAEITRTRTENSAVLKANQQLTKHNSEVQEQLSVLNAENQQLITKNSGLAETAYNLDIVLTDVRNNHQRSQQQNTKLFEQLAELKNQKSAQMAEFDNLKKELFKLQHNLQMEKNSYEETRENNEVLENENVKLFNELAQANSDNIQLHNDREHLQKLAVEHKGLIQDMQRKNKTLEEAAVHSKEDIALLKEEKQILLNTNEKLRESYDDERKQNKEKVTQLKEDLALLKVKNQVFCDINERLLEERDDLKKTMKRKEGANEEAATLLATDKGILESSCSGYNLWPFDSLSLFH